MFFEPSLAAGGPRWLASATEGGPPDCATKPGHPNPECRISQKTPTDIPPTPKKQKELKKKPQSHPSTTAENKKFNHTQTRTPKSQKIQSHPNPNHRNPQIQSETRKLNHTQTRHGNSRKFRPWTPGPPKKSVIFKSPSWDLSRTFLKPESPKTQIPGDGDSRRPRRPRRTTTHTLLVRKALGSLIFDPWF